MPKPRRKPIKKEFNGEHAAGINDLQSVARLVNWDDYDKLLGKVFYEKFGRLLEQTMNEYNGSKQSLKECVRRNYGNPKAMPTPKNLRPLAALKQQIGAFHIDFGRADSSEDEADDEVGIESTIMEIDCTAAAVENVDIEVIELGDESTVVVTINNDVFPVHPPALENIAKKPEKILHTNEPRDLAGHDQPAAPHTPQPCSSKTAAKHAAVAAKLTSTARKPNLNNTFVRKQKLEIINGKLKESERHREDLLKQKAERTKREREERQQRVDQKLRAKEVEQKEREEHLRLQEERIREFQAEQKRLAAQPFSPLRGTAAKKPNTQKTPGQFKATQPLKTPLKTPTKLPPLLFSPLPVKKLVAGNGMPNTLAKASANVEQPKAVAKQPARVEQPKAIVKEPARVEQLKAVAKEPVAAKNPVAVIQPTTIVQQQSTSTANAPKTPASMAIQNTSAYDMTLDKIYLPSTEDNYNVDDLSSGDETDNDEHPRKTVPRWAQKENLAGRVHALHDLVGSGQVERYFGRMIQPSIKDFFADFYKANRKQYPKRTSSADWNSPMSDPTPGVGRFQQSYQQNK